MGPIQNWRRMVLKTRNSYLWSRIAIRHKFGKEISRNKYFLSITKQQHMLHLLLWVWQQRIKIWPTDLWASVLYLLLVLLSYRKSKEWRVRLCLCQMSLTSLQCCYSPLFLFKAPEGWNQWRLNQLLLKIFKLALQIVHWLKQVHQVVS